MRPFAIAVAEFLMLLWPSILPVPALSLPEWDLLLDRSMISPATGLVRSLFTGKVLAGLTVFTAVTDVMSD